MAPWTAGIVVIVFTRSEPDGGYYDNVIFHRVIPKLMIQTGDPLGDGTGGTSTWDRDFEDEFADDVKHESARLVRCDTTDSITTTSVSLEALDKNRKRA
ncbi:hypothetical protein EDB85DRAFT_2142090 [Lactarius pseudohatsudake]|nr:hypothetical protein EDB85DRAFT_2142090 [Lactarius pseudohatsudake]